MYSTRHAGRKVGHRMMLPKRRFLPGSAVMGEYFELTDGVTTMRLGVINGALNLWYTDTNEVIVIWNNN